MAKRVSVDKWMFSATLLLVFLGLVTVFSASAVMAQERFGSPYYFVIRQLIWAVSGTVIMLLLMRTDYRLYKHPAVPFVLLGITTLLLIAVLFLDRSHNTHRWIRLGPLSLQPSELAKPALILFLAYFLESRLNTIDDRRRTLLPAVAPCVIFAGLILLQPDLGTALACVAISLCVLFVAGMHVRYLLWAATPAPFVFYFFIYRVPWRFQRIQAFLDPYSDPLGRGFHTIQSLIAVGTGGVTGQGLMEGKQKLFYLPETHTDFIFAVWAEEIGLIGCLLIAALFALLIARGARAAFVSRDNFARLLATGITSMIAVQALWNISVTLGLLPTKGIPLPFVSYGGSSLLISLASMGILLNITQQAE